MSIVSKDKSPLAAAGSNAPPSLVWMCVRKQNAFLKKQRHSGKALFSSEAFNLTGKHNFASSGLANTDAIDISADGTLSQRVSANKPKSGSSSSKLGQDPKKGDKAVVSATTSYRKDLRAAARARFTKIFKASRVNIETRAVKTGRTSRRN